MNPAPSIILFSTLSGAGFGMLTWLGLLAAIGALPAGADFGLAALAPALLLTIAGLCASTFHLGRPERAWRALSQWRTSWLSREGVLALLTVLAALLFGLLWWRRGDVGAGAALAGLLTAALALGSVHCTAMIYASLKPVRQWNTGLTSPVYLLNALASGGACLAAVTAFFSPLHVVGPAFLGAAAASGALVAKRAYWQRIDTEPTATTAETATGLGGIGRVRMLAAPNTEESYLMREMGFAIGRKHAAKLRDIAMGAGYAVPVVLLALSLLAAQAAPVLTPIAALAAIGGMLAERWLFFAEATHTVALYYGRAA